MLLLASPVMLAAAIAIKLDSRGPVFFRQIRIGRLGEDFEIIKFRTMREGADSEKSELAHLNETDGLFKIEADPRITRIGKLLRASSIDELPQLFNVLRGDMSLVGPRPLVPHEDVAVTGWYRRRSSITPGITGAWQLHGPVSMPLDEMMRTDYLYVANWSWWSDAKIMLRTVRHVLARRGV
jgi:lipopolysaccharide/colanic/teichoic acid biosynthesis glycosyltransferase